MQVHSHLLARAPHQPHLSLPTGVHHHCANPHKRLYAIVFALLLMPPLLYLSGSHLCKEVTFLQGHVLPSPAQNAGTPGCQRGLIPTLGEALGAEGVCLSQGGPQCNGHRDRSSASPERTCFLFIIFLFPFVVEMG